MPCIPSTTLLYKTTTPRYEACRRLLSGTLLYSHSPLISLTLSQFSKLHILVQVTFPNFTAHICISCCVLPMTNFYRRLSNCQPHHTEHISVLVSTTVLTITTAHNTAISIPVLIALSLPLHGDSPRAHVRLTLAHIMIDK
jgi:hypothetical protein